MGGTDYSDPGILWDSIRTICAFLDKAAYGLLAIMYEIFFNVAGAELFESATIKHFYSRVQLIIGVFMVFKLAVSIIQGIMNPDKFTDPKQGFGSVITRVIISLAMLVVIVPINIPDAEPYSFNARLNNDGLLFGILYSFQDRVLSNNTLGRLILGTSDNLTTPTDEDPEGMTAADKQAQQLTKSANLFASTILRGFVRVNMVEGQTDETNPDFRMCTDEDSGTLIRDVYAAEDATPSQILELVDESCETAGFLERVGNTALNFLKSISNFVLKTDFETKQSAFYVFSYSGIISTVIAVVFAIVLVGFTLDIAIRAIKLSILRLIAPIPIISYIDPKSAEKGAFASWVKMLTSTYLDIFLRLAIIYFVIFLIQDMMVNGIFVNVGSGVIGVITFIFICLGLFYFAKQAPKFIKDALGIQGLGMSNVGLSAMLAATGAIRQGGSILDTMDAVSDVKRAQDDAYNQGKPMPSPGIAYNVGRDTVAKMLTGDANMTGRKMSRGARHLKAMDVDSFKAAELKGKMYDAQDEAALAKHLQDKVQNYGWNSTNNDEKTRIANAYRRARNIDPGRALTGDEVEEMKEYGATMYASQMSSAAGKAESDYKKVEGMQKQYGQARTYEAQYEGAKDENGRYVSKRNILNRAISGRGLSTGEDSTLNQFRRTQNVDNLVDSGRGAGATTVDNPNAQGADFTRPGDTGGRM